MAQRRHRLKANSVAGWAVSGLILGGVVVGGYFGWRWLRDRVGAVTSGITASVLDAQRKAGA